jgi:hypothetical protein
MAENTDAVRVGVLMKVYAAPIGTALPTDLAALSASFTEVGLVDLDALTESLDVTKEILRANQKPNGVRTLTTEINWTWQFKAMERNALVLELFYLGATSAVATGITTTTIPASPGDTRKVFVVEEFDGDVHTRFVIPAGDVTARGEVPHRGTEGVSYDMTVAVLGTSLSDLGYIISDDPFLAADAS